jgi:acetolactate synthase-1/2/3 large subunit
MVVVSGQVKSETLVRSTKLPLRQLGDQEVDIIRAAEPFTKYAQQITDPRTVRYHLERAIHLAGSGRPGPVWLDIPMNVQGAQVAPDELSAYNPAEDGSVLPPAPSQHVLDAILTRIERAKRPVIYAGAGVRLAGMTTELCHFAESRSVPIVTAFNAHDLLPETHPLLAGRPGTIGNRAGNFAVQNADLLLILGCRLNIRQVSYNWRSFAPRAVKIMVDIDAAELHKPTLQVDLPVHADLRSLMPLLAASSGRTHDTWAEWCRERRVRYPVVQPEYWQTDTPINPYALIDALSDVLPDDAVIVTGDGTACVATFQALRIRGDQRLYSNSGAASMGWDVPAAIGAARGAPDRTVVCLAGDGSIMMNVQDLATISHHDLPVKIILLNNGGYHSIRLTQKNFFSGNPVGYDPASGVGFPEWSTLAAAFRLEYQRVDRHEGLRDRLRAFLHGPGCGFLEVVLDPEQPFAPKTSSRREADGTMTTAPLEDMAPFLSREELESNIIRDTNETEAE